MDIIERLEKLENLVRHDDEARTICADARAEIVKLRGVGNAGAAANAASGGTWYHLTSGGSVTRQFTFTPPPSRTTQVKMEAIMEAALFESSLTRFWTDEDGVVHMERISPTRGV